MTGKHSSSFGREPSYHLVDESYLTILEKDDQKVSRLLLIMTKIIDEIQEIDETDCV